MVAVSGFASMRPGEMPPGKAEDIHEARATSSLQ